MISPIFRMMMLSGLIAALLVFISPPAGAHELPYTVVTIDRTKNGQLDGALYTHVPAYILGGAPQHLLPQEAAHFTALTDQQLAKRIDHATEIFRQELYFALDGVEIETPLPQFPDLATLRDDALINADAPRPSAPIRFTVDAPGATLLTFAGPKRLGQIAIVYNSGGETKTTQFLDTAELSTPIDLLEAPSAGDTLFTFVAQGILHIVPLGLDHILFVVLLTIVSTRITLLLVQVTGFTLAHTFTLGLVALGVFTPPASIIEPLIALSIAGMAFLNLVPAQETRVRGGAIIGFGLLHGAGFAGALAALGLPKGQEILALAAFNFGVEVGQVLVIGAVLACLAWAMEKPWYRKFLLIPISIAIGGLGLIWTVERIFFV